MDPPLTAADTDLILTTSSLGNPPFLDLLDAASAAGFDGLSIWPEVDYGQALDAGLTDRQIRSRLDDSGLRVNDVDALIRWVGPDDPGRPYFEEPPSGLLWDVANLLGARWVNLLLVGSRASSFEHAVPVLAEACDEAREHGMELTLEFAKGTAVPDLATAVHMIEASGRSNVTVLLDAWQQHWGRTTLEDVAGPLGRHIGAVQLCDGPAERPVEFAHATRRGRLAPTDGAFDLPGLVAALDGHGFAGPYTVEVLNDALPLTLGIHETATYLATRTRALLATAPTSTPTPTPTPATPIEASPSPAPLGDRGTTRHTPYA